MRRLYFFTLTLVTIIASHPFSLAADVNGSLKALCLASQGSELTTLAAPKVHMEITDEAQSDSSGDVSPTRRLVARIEIHRANLFVESVKLVASVNSLRTVTFDQFKSFCGTALVYGNTMGQSVEAVWMIKGPLTGGRKFFARDLDLAQFNEVALAQFAQTVAATLGNFDGKIAGYSLNIQPAGAFDASACGGMLGCLSQLLKTSPRSAQVPLSFFTLDFTPEIVKAIQCGVSFPLVGQRHAPSTL